MRGLIAVCFSWVETVLLWLTGNRIWRLNLGCYPSGLCTKLLSSESIAMLLRFRDLPARIVGSDSYSRPRTRAVISGGSQRTRKVSGRSRWTPVAVSIAEITQDGEGHLNEQNQRQRLGRKALQGIRPEALTPGFAWVDCCLFLMG